MEYFSSLSPENPSTITMATVDQETHQRGRKFQGPQTKYSSAPKMGVDAVSFNNQNPDAE
jgi:hypothetical protein